MAGKVFSGDKLLDRFNELLTTAHSVDIATAWATPGRHLQALRAAVKSRRVKVRAIVGISGNATHPDALWDLREIATDDLRIVPKGDRLFHPKLYLFKLRVGGIEEQRAWIGSANFTRAGFGGHSAANEEVVLELDPGERASALADWFQERWDRCPVAPLILEEIRRYQEDWNRNPPNRQVRRMTSGAVTHRRDLLDDAHRPLTLEGYHRALKECEEKLRDEGWGWGVLDPQGQSYMRVIDARRKLLLGATSWSKLDADRKLKLMGSRRKGIEWWGLMGRVRSSHIGAVLGHQEQILATLEWVEKARDHEFPDIAVDAMGELMDIDYVGPGTATLMLALARPDRLLSLNGASEKGLGALASMKYSTLRKPEKYGNLLRWLYRQPWYADGPPPNGNLEQIWRFRAALVDSFVYERT